MEIKSRPRLKRAREHLAEQRHERDRLILRSSREMVDTADLVERDDDHLFDLAGELVFRA